MAFDPHAPERLQAQLQAIRADLTSTVWPATPADGLVATCRLSDDIRIIALAGYRAQHPTASNAELEEMLDECRIRWEQISRRLRIRVPSSFPAP